MHETIIASRIIEEASKKGNVKSITLKVGELAELENHELEETLAAMVPWQVNTRKVGSKVRCDCGYVGKAKITGRAHETVIYECPRCGDLPKVISGNTITLEEVEVD